MFDAVRQVDRAALGFTPIPRDARLRVEWRPRAGYDAMLHVDGKTSRTIAFARNGTAYAWIGEQEIFRGPRTFKSPDGVLRESITITYETRPLSGAPLKTVHITYFGDDAELGFPRTLTLERVKPVLERWARDG